MLKLTTEKGIDVDLEWITFPGGEEHVRITKYILPKQNLKITARITSSKVVMQLLLLTDAVRRTHNPSGLILELEYFPYARQDRVACYGESLSVKVMADLINSQNYDSVIVYDLHSLVSEALLNNATHIQQCACVCQTKRAREFIEGNDVVFVAPDEGASKKTASIASFYKTTWVQGIKLRDPSTGELSGFGLRVEDGSAVNGKNLIMVDDICDGGGTFLGLLAHINDNYSPNSTSLFVTHGIFSKGRALLTSSFHNVFARFDWRENGI